MREQSNVQPQNRNRKSKGSAYLLSNGQRVPVLFRLKNLQTPHGKNSLGIDPVSVAMQGQTPATSSAAAAKADSMAIEAHSSETRPFVGPSWMRRNAYRVTVLCLLIATVLLLNNNRSRHSNPFEVAGTAKSKDTVAQSNPDTKSALANNADSESISTQSSSNSRPETPKSNTVVETTATDSGTEFVITNTATEPVMNSSSSDPTAVTQLLAPQGIDQSDSMPVANGPAKSNTLTVPAQQVSTGAVPATNPNDSNNSSNTNTGLDSQRNRYTVSTGGESGSNLEDEIPSTNAPPPDPSDLFALFQQQTQIQTADDTIRAMRPRSQPSSNWQAVPVSSNTMTNGYSNNASTVNSRKASERAQGFMSYPPSGQGYQTNSRQLDSSNPQWAAEDMQPPRTQYQPIYAQYGSDFGINNQQNLYSTPSMPQGYQQTPSSAQSPYQPLYPTGGNSDYQDFMGSQLYDAADQSSGNYMAP